MVATELAVFLLGEIAVGGDVAVFSFVEFRESQEKGLVSFREGPGGAAGGGAEVGFGCLGGDSFWPGDHGMDGRAFVMLLRDNVLEGSFSGWLFFVSFVSGLGLLFSSSGTSFAVSIAQSRSRGAAGLTLWWMRLWQ